MDALDGKPGIYSARWSGATGDVDRANLELVLDQTKDVSDDLRGAQFVCAAAYVGADGREFTTRGTVSGMLLRAPRGTNGFGYDPIFLPDGFQITTAQMTAEQKDSISHRSKALAQLVQLITS